MTIRVHISLGVNDLEKSISFYEALFGKKVSKLREEYANFAYDSPPIFLSIITKKSESKNGEPAAANVLELGFELPSEKVFDEWRTRLVKSGLEYYEQVIAECCYSEGRKLWFRDPEGNRWEIFLHTGEADHLPDNDPKARAFLQNNEMPKE